MTLAETLQQCLSEESFTRLLLDTAANEEQRESLRKALESRTHALASERMVISVLGVQGAGKSSLLNALVAGDDFLPVEADETTCVPVEITRSRDGQRKVTVALKNGDMAQIPATRESLDQYVNNAHNPGNRMGVRSILAEIPSEILTEGVVFVDLPGVGSLTEANQETTLDYIRTCTGAIFLLRTIPPITASESNFLRVAWPQLSQVVFVQNRWSGDTDCEVDDAKRHNESVLIQIARESRLQQGVEVLPVHVREATRAVYTGDAALRARTGLDELVRRVHMLKADWRQSVQRDIAMWLISLGSIAEAQCRQISKDLSGDSDLVEAEILAEREAFRGQKEQFYGRFDSLRERVREQTDSIADQMRTLIDECQAHASEQVNVLISGGITDGSHFAESMQKLLEDAQTRVLEDLQFRVRGLAEEVLAEFGEVIQDVSLHGCQVRAEGGVETLKIEKAIPAVLGTLGGAGGPALVAALLTNPAGWIVIAGSIVTSLIGLFVGNRSKSRIQAQRQENARAQASRQIRDFFSSMERPLRDQLYAIARDLVKQLSGILDSEIGRIEAGLRERLLTLESARSDYGKTQAANEARLQCIVDHTDRIKASLSS